MLMRTLLPALCLFGGLATARAADPAPDAGAVTIDIDVIAQRLDAAASRSSRIWVRAASAFHRRRCRRCRSARTRR